MEQDVVGTHWHSPSTQRSPGLQSPQLIRSQPSNSVPQLTPAVVQLRIGIQVCGTQFTLTGFVGTYPGRHRQFDPQPVPPSHCSQASTFPSPQIGMHVSTHVLARHSKPGRQVPQLTIPQPSSNRPHRMPSLSQVPVGTQGFVGIGTQIALGGSVGS